MDSIALEQEIEHNGEDFGIDSEEGAAIAYGLEGAVERELVRPQDLKPENFTSVKRLSDLLYKNMQKPIRKRPQ